MVQLKSIILMGRLRRHCLRKNVECFMVPVAGSPEINVKPSF